MGKTGESAGFSRGGGVNLNHISSHVAIAATRAVTSLGEAVRAAYEEVRVKAPKNLRFLQETTDRIAILSKNALSGQISSAQFREGVALELENLSTVSAATTDGDVERSVMNRIDCAIYNLTEALVTLNNMVIVSALEGVKHET